jgi:4-diphosphocytidyl-2-C-methyl-D-erythritol kinase
LVPPCPVSTAEIFSSEALTRQTTPITIAAFREQGGRNDCEPVVRALHPEVAFALDWLSQFSPARMTGTGACVFAGFDDRVRAEQVLQRIPDDFQGFVARSVNRSPLHERLGL